MKFKQLMPQPPAKLPVKGLAVLRRSQAGKTHLAARNMIQRTSRRGLPVLFRRRIYPTGFIRRRFQQVTGLINLHNALNEKMWLR